jgi:signal transduction histidine kinase
VSQENRSSIQTPLLLGILMILGAILAFWDDYFQLDTVLLELVYTSVVLWILFLCLKAQRQYPEIRQFGWPMIVSGLCFFLVGSILDIFDDHPTGYWLFEFPKQFGIYFDRSWEAYLEKVMGNTVGLGLIAFGLFQWIPWMIEARKKVERLNQTLSHTNKQLSRILMSLDEHIESERLKISRELHDDVAQQITFLKLQVQICQKELGKSQQIGALASLGDNLGDKLEPIKARLETISQEISETLKSVRQMSHELRPESLYALGLIPAMERFLEKMRIQFPETDLGLTLMPSIKGHDDVVDEAMKAATDEAVLRSTENYLNERELLHLYRLLQEGVRNALKHSGGSQIQVRFLAHPEAFLFQVVDNGKGLPWNTIPKDDILIQEGHLGVVGMQERVKEMEGEFRLYSQGNPHNTHTRQGAEIETLATQRVSSSLTIMEVAIPRWKMQKI